MFHPVENGNRFVAMDMVEEVVAGRPGEGQTEIRAAIGVLLDRGSSQAETVAATSTALQEDWAGKYAGGNTALMMAGAVAAARIGRDVPADDRTQEDDALAAGRFWQLSAERQDGIASDINRGILLSARERHDVSDKYEMRLAHVPVAAERGDDHEDVRRAIETASHELNIGPTEWHGPGDRGAVSFLLHVQAPALLRVSGADDRGDPVNAQYIQQEADRFSADGIGESGTIHGIRHNLNLANEMSRWLAPTLSATTLSASAPDGPIARLAEKVDQEIAGRSRPGPAIVQAIAAGAANAR